MKKAGAIAATSVVSLLIMAGPCYGHSLAPVFWWLGPFAVVVAVSTFIGCVSLIAIIVGQAVLLQRFVPGTTFIHSLWRAPFIFIVSRVTGALPALLNPDVFMGPCPESAMYIIAVFMFISASATDALLIAILYRRVQPKVERIIPLAIALEGMLCLGLYLTNTALFQLGVIR